jgi:hypothetical protein
LTHVATQTVFENAAPVTAVVGTQPATAADDADPLSGNEVTELNSARVSGDDCPEWQALLERTLTFLVPDDLTKGVEQKRWTNATGTLRTWIEGQKVKGGPVCGLSRHLERKAKGYFPIVFGKSAGKDRTANAMVTQECKTLDVESGDFYLDAVDRAAELGLACIAYTSFNDQTEESHIERDKVLTWPDAKVTRPMTTCANGWRLPASTALGMSKLSASRTRTSTPPRV